MIRRTTSKVRYIGSNSMEPAMREQDALHVLIQGAIPKSRKPFLKKRSLRAGNIKHEHVQILAYGHVGPHSLLKKSAVSKWEMCTLTVSAK